MSTDISDDVNNSSRYNRHGHVHMQQDWTNHSATDDCRLEIIIREKLLDRTLPRDDAAHSLTILDWFCRPTDKHNTTLNNINTRSHDVPMSTRKIN